MDTSIHTYIYTRKRKNYTQEANKKVRFGPTYMHAFNVYTPNIYIYIQHTSIHIHAYNLHVIIKIVNTNKEALYKMKANCIP